MMKHYLLSFILILTGISSVYASTQEASIGDILPNAPTNLAAAIDDGAVDLTWSAPVANGGSAITDYQVEYKTTVGGVWTVFADGVSTNTTATVTGLTNDTSYDFRVSGVNDGGVGAPSSVVSATPGAPAQVLIQSFSSLLVPTIATLVRITNEGVTAYEYQYTWCVTDSVNNLCGGGDDVFSSTAAKLIQPGEDFDTTLYSTIPTPGNYYFHLSVDFGSDTSIANQSFTAVSTPSSGGGGGGGSSSTQPSSNACTGADLNGDTKVDSIDFSILLAFWKTSAPFSNACVDINHDTEVDSVDFSILLFQWGKNPVAVN